MVLAMGLGLIGCSKKEDNQAMGEALAEGMRRQSEAYKSAAQAPVYTPPRQQNCYVHQTSPQHSTRICR